MQIELELLAPAKNREIGIAAVDCGADALYMAGPAFGAREAAGNSIDEIAALASYAKQYNVKLYLTLNTILYDNELEAAGRLIFQAYEAGCDAVIVQDLALLQMELPPIRLFASTQANITTISQALFLKKLGFERLILARELSLKQITQIKQAANMELEAFVHGALCVSYSGQCYLSEALLGRSANRGSCAQVCRTLFTLKDSSGRVYEQNKPLLSLKDLNLSRRIPDLVASGVTSFKIEGRLKGSSYVKNIVRLYRAEIDKFIAQNPTQYARSSAGKIEGGFTPNAALTFNRGFTEYFIDEKRADWRSGAAAKYIGERVGVVTSCKNVQSGALTFEYKGEKGATPIVNGDGLCFVKPNGEVVGLRANSCDGNRVSTTERAAISNGAAIYRNFNIAFERELEKNMPKRVIEVALKVDITQMGKITIAATSENRWSIERSFELEHDIAQRPEMALENITRQLGKRSGIFAFKVVELSHGNQIPFIALSRLNEFRRMVAEGMAKKIEESSRAVAPKRVKESGSAKFLEGQEFSYLANVSNSLSKELYYNAGAKRVEAAYELEHREGVELMCTKHCIRYSLGYCFKENPVKAAQIKEPLYLINGETKLELKFDCKNCRMFVIR